MAERVSGLEKVSMKACIFWIVVGFCLGSGTAAALGGTDEFGPQDVIGGADQARSVYAADLDGDGDADVLSASWADDEIRWYQNVNGLGTFYPGGVISTAADQAASVSAADLDGDGDADVLSASWADNKIAWYENTDGAGSFGAQKLISTAAKGASCVSAADLDGDGDLDVVSCSQVDGKIAWYQNTNGLGSFGAQQLISTATIWAMAVAAADLDGDGDADVLSASQYDDKVAWYENTDGAGSFGAQKLISTAADGAASVLAADLDGDGDADVLSASRFDSKIAWYENTNGLGAFGAQQVISTAALGAYSAFAADLDEDGDLDVLSASFLGDKIAWYENADGLGGFGAEHAIWTLANGAIAVFAADLDGDGDADALSASYDDDRIAWYENLMGVLQPDMGYQGPGDVAIQVWGQALSSGNTASFTLTGAPPNAATLVFLSPFFKPTYVWEAGGYLCPILPPLLLVFLSTDGSGEINYPNGVPGGGGLAVLYVQAVCQDALQPQGFAVSNCVRIELLP